MHFQRSSHKKKYPKNCLEFVQGSLLNDGFKRLPFFLLFFFFQGPNEALETTATTIYTHRLVLQEQNTDNELDWREIRTARYLRVRQGCQEKLHFSVKLVCHGSETARWREAQWVTHTESQLSRHSFMYYCIRLNSTVSVTLYYY